MRCNLSSTENPCNYRTAKAHAYMGQSFPLTLVWVENGWQVHTQHQTRKLDRGEEEKKQQYYNWATANR